MERRNKPLIAAFAMTLRDQRASVGMTQETLAERADLSVRAVSFFETGKRQPTLSALAAISKGLGVDMVELMREIDHLYRKDE